MSTEINDNLERLLNCLADGTLSEGDEMQLTEILRSHASARRLYRQFMMLHADMHWDYAAATVFPSDTSASLQGSGDAPPTRRRRISRWRRLGAVAALLMLAVVARFLLFPHAGVELDADRLPIGCVTRLAGEVRLTYQGRQQDIREDVEFRAGATIYVRGLSGLALLRLDDGTELSLTGETRIECMRPDGQTSITVHQGQLSANVTPQPANRPLVIHTPNSQIEVLGTRFLVSTDDNASELGVRQGSVRFQRLSDGRSIDVAAGQYAIASQRSTLEARSWPTALDAWREDFEDGLPDDWRYGQWVDNSLPDGSKGGVRASRRFALDGSDSSLYRITLPKQWTRGLWQIQHDTQLHFTYKMSRPGWFHIMMGVRSDDLNPSHVGNYELQSSYWAKAAPDQWRTVSVPLSAFRKNIRGVEYAALPSTPPRVGDVVTLLWFNTGNVDRGLVIDRIWIERGNQMVEDSP